MSIFTTHPLSCLYSPHTLCHVCTHPTPCVKSVFTPHPMSRLYSPHTLCQVCIHPTPCVTSVFTPHLVSSLYSPHILCQVCIHPISCRLYSPNWVFQLIFRHSYFYNNQFIYKTKIAITKSNLIENGCLLLKLSFICMYCSTE